MSDRQEERAKMQAQECETSVMNGEHSAEPYHPDRRNPPAHDLGSPLSIEEVAELLGCSPWTVRQRYLRQGLPHLQASTRGKLIFFREQIIAWVEKRQRQKGALPR